MILNQKISFWKKRTSPESRLSTLVVLLSSMRRFTPTFSPDSIGHQKSCWVFLIHRPLTCGLLDVLWLNYILVILCFQERVKTIRCPESWKWETSHQKMCSVFQRERWNSSLKIKIHPSLSQSWWKTPGVDFESRMESHLITWSVTKIPISMISSQSA